MSYTVIAQEDITLYGMTANSSKDVRTFVILERFSDEETVTEIGISGDPLFVMGSSGNDMFYSFSPIQIQFTIIDQFGFRAKFANRKKKDFKLQVKNGETVEYELYLYLPSNNSEYFETNPEIDLVATNAIGLLKEEYFKPTDTLIELKDFLFECLSRLGFDYAIEVYSLWSSADNAKTFPLGYRVNRSYQVRFKDSDQASFFDVLENFCIQYNLQLYQTDNTWIFIERKLRLNAPASINGIDLATELPVARSLAAILNADTVLRKPKSTFKPGLKEIKTSYLLGAPYFSNSDFSACKTTQNEIPGWQKRLDAGSVEVVADANGIYPLLNFSPDNSINEGWVKQKTGAVLANNLTQKDTIELQFELEIEILTDVSQFGDTYSINYMKAFFYELDGTVHILNNNLTWTTDLTPDPQRFSSAVPEGETVTISSNYNIQPPPGKIGYFELEFRLYDTGDEDPVANSCIIRILDLSINFIPEIDREIKLFVNSRGLKNQSPQVVKHSVGDIDDYGDVFVFEYYDTNDEWVPANYISNDGSERSIFEVAPYQRLCQANKDQIEYSTIRTWKYLYPDFLKTILFDQANDAILYTIPIEVKWNMVTGEIEIYSAEAFEDTTGVTRLTFYSEEDYEAINADTLLTSEGVLLNGFTRGNESEDARGFEVEFDAPSKVTASSAVIEVGGVDYELDTLILEE